MKSVTPHSISSVLQAHSLMLLPSVLAAGASNKKGYFADHHPYSTKLIHITAQLPKKLLALCPSPVLFTLQPSLLFQSKYRNQKMQFPPKQSKQHFRFLKAEYIWIDGKYEFSISSAHTFGCYQQGVGATLKFSFSFNFTHQKNLHLRVGLHPDF